MDISHQLRLTILRRASAMSSGGKTSDGTKSVNTVPIDERANGFLTSLPGNLATNL